MSAAPSGRSQRRSESRGHDWTPRNGAEERGIRRRTELRFVEPSREAERPASRQCAQIRFSRPTCPAAFTQILADHFPLLGGNNFRLYYCRGNGKKLLPIPQPAEGYSPDHVNSFTKKGIVYIRPLIESDAGGGVECVDEHARNGSQEAVGAPRAPARTGVAATADFEAAGPSFAPFSTLPELGSIEPSALSPSPMFESDEDDEDDEDEEYVAYRGSLPSTSNTRARQFIPSIPLFPDDTFPDEFFHGLRFETADKIRNKLLSLYIGQHQTMPRGENLLVNREVILERGLQYFKNATMNASMFYTVPYIQFLSMGHAEAGIDGGGLVKSFFSEFVTLLVASTFEGDNERLVPRKDVTIPTEHFRYLGMALSYSIVHFNMTPASFAPYVFGTLMGLTDSDLHRFDPKYLPTIADIPKNAATESLLELFEKLNGAETEEEFQNLFSEPLVRASEYYTLLNGSGLDPTTHLTRKIAFQLATQLLYHELLRARWAQLASLKEGLKLFGISACVKEYKSTCEKWFTANYQLNVEIPLRLKYHSDQGYFTHEQLITHEYFREFLRGASDLDLVKLVYFATGVSERAFLSDARREIRVVYVSTIQALHANICADTIQMPTWFKDAQALADFLRVAIYNAVTVEMP